jgi:hypothetical protein
VLIVSGFKVVLLSWHTERYHSLLGLYFGLPDIKFDDVINEHPLSFFQLNDAYEEVDEQRQVVAQWKRKTQKLQGEMHDQKLLLEEQVNKKSSSILIFT